MGEFGGVDAGEADVDLQRVSFVSLFFSRIKGRGIVNVVQFYSSTHSSPSAHSSTTPIHPTSHQAYDTFENYPHRPHSSLYQTGSVV